MFDLQPSYLPSGPDDLEGIEKADREVMAAMQMMGQAQKGMEGLEAGRLEETGEMMIDEMMAQFEELGEKEDYNVRQDELCVCQLTSIIAS